MKKLNNNIANVISSLEWAVSRNNRLPRSTDEFTASEFANKTGMAVRTAQSVLSRMTQDGLLSVRKLPVDGKSTNLYTKC